MNKVLISGSSGMSGGLQIHFEKLEAFLRCEGYEVLAIKVDDGKKPVKRQNQSHILWVPSGSGGLKSKVLKIWLWFLAILKARYFKPDLYISTACGQGYALLGRALSKNAYGFFQIATDDYSSQDKRIKAMINSHQAVAVQSNGLIESFRMKINNRHTIRVLPCFHQIENNIFCASPPHKNDVLKLAYFGRLAGNKGLQLVLKVLAYLEDLPWRFDIYGSGSEKPELLEIIANNPVLQQRVVMKGPYPAGEQYASLLASYHGLLAPSQATEGIPLVLLEASSAGLPFLSCRIGAIGDCAIDNPDVLIVDTGEIALQNGILLFCEKLRNGQFNNQRLKSWFEANHTIAKYQQAWREMLVSPGDFFHE